MRMHSDSTKKDTGASCLTIAISEARQASRDSSSIFHTSSKIGTPSSNTLAQKSRTRMGLESVSLAQASAEDMFANSNSNQADLNADDGS